MEDLIYIMTEAEQELAQLSGYTVNHIHELLRQLWRGTGAAGSGAFELEEVDHLYGASEDL